MHAKETKKINKQVKRNIEGFPDNFKIPVADVSAYKQFGNSVAIPAIQATANKILELIDLISNDNRK